MSTPSYIGENVPTVVLDVGTYQIKAGFAGDDTPKAIFSSHVGTDKKPSKKGTFGSSVVDKMDIEEKSPIKSSTGDDQSNNASSYYVGTQLNFRRDNIHVESPYDPFTNQIVNWDLYEKILEYTFEQRLRAKVNEHPLLMSEIPYIDKKSRTRLTEILVEKFDVPALFFSKSPVLSCFSYGKSNGLVVDVGYNGTCVTPVSDGYVLKKAICRNGYGGKWMNDEIFATLKEKLNINVKPNYSFEKKVVNPLNASTQSGTKEYKIVDKDFPNTTESYRRYCIYKDVIEDMKQSSIQASDTPFDEKLNNNVPTISYELVDGQQVTLGTERYSFVEHLFQPSSLYKEKTGRDMVSASLCKPFSDVDPNILKSDSTYVDTKAVHYLAKKSFDLCDPDIKRDLINACILTGGTSLFNGFAKRFTAELSSLTEDAKVKVPFPAQTLPVEKKFSCWIGGSILSTCGSFQQMWMSKQEYMERGKNVIHKRCP